MPNKLQSTNLNLHLGKALERLELWGTNPWRRYSLFLIFLLTGFLLGSSIGTINGVLALMDPIGAFFTVILIEFLVRVRRLDSQKRWSISKSVLDIFRIGFVYGLFMEGFKLL